MIEEDQEAEAAINDSNLILDGLYQNKEGDKRFKDAVERKKKVGKLQKFGIGADAQAEEDAKDETKMERREVPLATAQDVMLVQAHLSDVRIATMVTATIQGTN